MHSPSFLSRPLQFQDFSLKTDSSVWSGLPEMSSDRDQGRAPSPRSNYQASNGTGGAVGPLAVSTDFDQSRSPMMGRNPYSAPPSSTAAIPGRSPLPTRSSTTGSSDADRNLSANMNPAPKARSEDLNHNQTYISSSPRPSPPFLTAAGSSRPNTPGARDPSNSGHSDQSQHSEASTSAPRPPPSSSSGSATLSST